MSCRLHSSEYCCSYLGTIEECIRLDFISESSECERRFSEQPSNIIDLDFVSLNSFKFRNKFLNE